MARFSPIQATRQILRPSWRSECLKTRVRASSSAQGWATRLVKQASGFSRWRSRRVRTRLISAYISWRGPSRSSTVNRGDGSGAAALTGAGLINVIEAMTRAVSRINRGAMLGSTFGRLASPPPAGDPVTEPKTSFPLNHPNRMPSRARRTLSAHLSTNSQPSGQRHIPLPPLLCRGSGPPPVQGTVAPAETLLEPGILGEVLRTYLPPTAHIRR